MPRSAAASIMKAVACPKSYSSQSWRRWSSGSWAVNTIVAAEPAMCLPPRSQALASSVNFSRPVTTTKCYGCQFCEDGARRPASRIRSRSSAAIGWSVYWRTLRRARMASHVSMRQSYRTLGPRCLRPAHEPQRLPWDVPCCQQGPRGAADRRMIARRQRWVPLAQLAEAPGVAHFACVRKRARHLESLAFEQAP